MSTLVKLTVAAGHPATSRATASQSQPAPPSLRNPLGGGLPQSSKAKPTSTAPPLVPTATTGTTSHDSGLSGGGVAVIAVGAMVLIVVIALVIWRDSRKRAPKRSSVRDRSGSLQPSIPGSKRAPKARKLSPQERKRRKRGRAR